MLLKRVDVFYAQLAIIIGSLFLLFGLSDMSAVLVKEEAARVPLRAAHESRLLLFFLNNQGLPPLSSPRLSMLQELRSCRRILCIDHAFQEKECC